MKIILSKVYLVLLVILASNNAAFSSAPTTNEPLSEDLHLNGTRVGTAAHTATTPAALLSEDLHSNGRQVGLDATHIVNIRQSLANEHVVEVNDVIFNRWFFRKCANWNEAIANTAGYLAMAATPAAAATMLISATATPYVVFAGSAAAVVKIFCMGLASCSAREAAERQQTLNNLTSVINMHPVDVTPTITAPEEERHA